MKLKLESYQENLSLMNMTNQRLLDLIDTKQGLEQNPGTEQVEEALSKITDCIEEIKKINMVIKKTSDI